MKNLLLPLLLILAFSSELVAQREQSQEGKVNNWPVHEYELINYLGKPLKAILAGRTGIRFKQRDETNG